MAATRERGGQDQYLQRLVGQARQRSEGTRQASETITELKIKYSQLLKAFLHSQFVPWVKFSNRIFTNQI